MRGFVGVLQPPEAAHWRPYADVMEDVSGRHPVETLVLSSGWVARSTPTRFRDDRLFFERDGLAVCSEGVLLNAARLRAAWAASDNGALVERLWRARGERFVSDCRGEFSGILVDSRQHRHVLYSSHLGGVPLYYVVDETAGALLFSTDLVALSRLMRQRGRAPALNEEAALCLLSFGFMLGSQTLIAGVRRLPGGAVGIFEHGRVSVQPYFAMSNEPNGLSQPAIVDGLTERFALAVREEWGKDLEYGLGHVATLSGGLDSRANVLTARSLGFGPALLLCMSVSDYADEAIAKAIADDGDHPFLFHSLGRGGYLADVATPVRLNGGLVFFDGSAHLLRLLGLVNLGGRGLLHTGMLGDGVMGSLLTGPRHVKRNCFAGSYLRVPLEAARASAVAEWEKHPNDELFELNNRGVNAVLNGYWTASRYCDCASPFLHVDVLDFALRIDPRLRYRERLYRQWVAATVPGARRFRWEATGFPPDAPEALGRARRLVRGARRRVFGERRHDAMTPREYWFRTNPALAVSWRTSFDADVDGLSRWPQVANAARTLFTEGGMRGMAHALTLARAVRTLGLG